MQSWILSLLLLLAPAAASAQVVDRHCTSALDQERADLVEQLRERDRLRSSLGMPPAEWPADDGVDCEAKRAKIAETSAWVGVDLIKLRERVLVQQEQAERDAAAQANRRAEAASVGELEQLRAEVRKLQRQRPGRSAVPPAAASPIDISTVQAGVIMTSLGGSFAISAALNGIVGAGAFVASSSIPGAEGLQTFALGALGAALLQAGLSGALLYFGADRLAVGLGAQRQ